MYVNLHAATKKAPDRVRSDSLATDRPGVPGTPKHVRHFYRGGASRGNFLGRAVGAATSSGGNEIAGNAALRLV